MFPILRKEKKKKTHITGYWNMSGLFPEERKFLENYNLLYISLVPCAKLFFFSSRSRGFAHKKIKIGAFRTLKLS